MLKGLTLLEAQMVVGFVINMYGGGGGGTWVEVLRQYSTVLANEQLSPLAIQSTNNNINTLES